MGDDGRPRRVSDDQLIAVFRQHEDPVLTVSEVTESVPIGKEAVYKRLENLVENGTLDSKKPGAKSKIYWLSTDD